MVEVNGEGERVAPEIVHVAERAFLNVIMRIVVVLLLTWTVDLALDGRDPAYRSALAFVIGVFPDAAWKALQAFVKLPLHVRAWRSEHLTLAPRRAS